MKKEYSTSDVTVVWQPEMCIHSEKCWRGLPGVFNPKGKPWINVEGAEAEAIVEQVGKCPSGALSIKVADSENEEIVKTVIEPAPNGPLLVYGTIKLKNKDGEQELKNKTTAFCRCGHSANKPYCDGAHAKNNFQAP